MAAAVAPRRVYKHRGTGLTGHCRPACAAGRPRRRQRPADLEPCSTLVFDGLPAQTIWINIPPESSGILVRFIPTAPSAAFRMASQGASLQNYNNELVKCALRPESYPRSSAWPCCLSRLACTTSRASPCLRSGQLRVASDLRSPCLASRQRTLRAQVPAICLANGSAPGCGTQILPNSQVHLFGRHRGSEGEARGGQSSDPARRGGEAKDSE